MSGQEEVNSGFRWHGRRQSEESACGGRRYKKQEPPRSKENITAPALRFLRSSTAGHQPNRCVSELQRRTFASDWLVCTVSPRWAPHPPILAPSLRQKQRKAFPSGTVAHRGRHASNLPLTPMVLGSSRCRCSSSHIYKRPARQAALWGPRVKIKPAH